MKSYNFEINNLDCASCALKVQDMLNELEDYENVNINYINESISFEYNGILNQNELLKQTQKIIRKYEPDVILKNINGIDEVQEFDEFEEIEEIEKKENEKIEENNKIKNEKTKETKETKKTKKTIEINTPAVFICSALIFCSSFYVRNEVLNILLIVLSYIILMGKTIIKAIKKLFHGSFDETHLMIISSIGAFILGEKLEGFLVVFLYNFGKMIEHSSISGSRKSIKELIGLKPDYANIFYENKIKTIKPEEVKIGDILIVKPGEKVPVDSIVLEGNASLNTMALTGESKPFSIGQKDNILAGSIVDSGSIIIEAKNIYKNSSVANILNLLENATTSKAKLQNNVEKLSKIYTPVVFVLAIIIGLIYPYFFDSLNFSKYIYMALTFLVISCPCAIVISVPLAYYMAIGLASKHNILIKGSSFLDNLKNINKIFLDKTGTLTTGCFEVCEFNIDKINLKKQDLTPKLLNSIIYSAQSLSNHPIANAIVKYLKQNGKVETLRIENFVEKPGFGICFKYNGMEFSIGKDINANNKDIISQVVVKCNKMQIAKIYLEDSLKPTTKKAIKSLKQKQIELYILTGDNQNVANTIAKKLDINKVHSNLLPEDKYNIIDDIINKNEKNKIIAFVGDGINDCPVIKRADIGISMGQIGQRSAIENSDIVLLNDDLDSINTAIDISNYTRKIIIQNLCFALGIKLLIFILTFLGISNMFLAVLSDVGVSILTILNCSKIARKKLDDKK